MRSSDTLNYGGQRDAKPRMVRGCVINAIERVTRRWREAVVATCGHCQAGTRLGRIEKGRKPGEDEIALIGGDSASTLPDFAPSDAQRSEPFGAQRSDLPAGNAVGTRNAFRPGRPRRSAAPH